MRFLQILVSDRNTSKNNDFPGVVPSEYRRITGNAGGSIGL
jgi:hypothetical protein